MNLVDNDKMKGYYYYYIIASWTLSYSWQRLKTTGKSESDKI